MSRGKIGLLSLAMGVAHYTHALVTPGTQVLESIFAGALIGLGAAWAKRP